jgi:hypothetical protein
MTASEIIALFSSGNGPKNEAGRTELAEALGISLSTVSSWGINHHIPAWRQPKILEIAAARGIPLSTSDFPPRPRKPAAEPEAEAA